MATNNKQQANIGAWDAMMANVAGQPEIEQLRAEVDRLRTREQALEAENAAMRPIVEAVAGMSNVLEDENGQHCCAVAYGPMDGYIHEPHCIVTQARAFVAAHPTSTAAAENETESAGGDDER